MEYTRYITRRRAKFKALSGMVNIPYGTPLENRGGFLTLNGKRLCSATGQNSIDYFVQNDDGRGLERGALVAAITDSLASKDGNRQARWEKVWADKLCQRYQRSDHADFWLWDQTFYEAPVDDLRYIAQLIGAKARK